jgi:hypothetical protein
MISNVFGHIKNTSTVCKFRTLVVFLVAITVLDIKHGDASGLII